MEHKATLSGILPRDTGGTEIPAGPFLTSVILELSVQVHASSALIPGKSPEYP